MASTSGLHCHNFKHPKSVIDQWQHGAYQSYTVKLPIQINGSECACVFIQAQSRKNCVTLPQVLPHMYNPTFYLNVFSIGRDWIVRASKALTKSHKHTYAITHAYTLTHRLFGLPNKFIASYSFSLILWRTAVRARFHQYCV